ncbi:hypothetical protein TNCV_1560931 [Trichonephila clavipes]|nr:hypothetical protein TNCV_1560931 [Trichonephila clavipes]
MGMTEAVFQELGKWPVVKIFEIMFASWKITGRVGTPTCTQSLDLIVQSKSNEFTLILYTNGFNDRVKDYMSLWLKKSSPDEILLQFTWEIIDSKVGHLEVKDAMELYYAADKYELDSLKDICVQIMVGNVKTDNVIDILLLSYRHSNPNLELICIHFIAKNASEIQDKAKWDFPEVINSIVVLKIPNPTDISLVWVPF